MKSFNKFSQKIKKILNEYFSDRIKTLPDERCRKE